MRALLKTFFAMLVICFVSVQSVSAQQKGPCTDTDIPGETEGTEEDSDDDKKEEDQADVQRDDNGNYWWNDDGEIKRVWPRDDPNAPWNQANKSTSAGDDLDQANPNDSPGPYDQPWPYDQQNPHDSPGPYGGEEAFADASQGDISSEIEWTYLLLLEMGLSDNEAMLLLFGVETTEEEEQRPTKITKPVFGPLITTF